MTSPSVRASDALPIPARANKLFLFLFFIATPFLLHRWSEKNKADMPIRKLTLADIVAFLAMSVSGVYMLCFFGVFQIQPCIPRQDEASGDDGAEENLRIARARVSSISPAPVQVQRKDETVIRGKDILERETVKDNSDEDIASTVSRGGVPMHVLEAELGDCSRAVSVRKRAVEMMTGRCLQKLPVSGFDYEAVRGQCCEMVIGFVQVPVGVAGPLLLDGSEYMVPMATTEGCLVASTNRGCKAIHLSGGASAIILKDGMTRAPVVRCSNAAHAAAVKSFLESPPNFEQIAAVFDRTSRFARLQTIQASLAGRNVFIRFTCSTGDAMGMNMVSKGVQNVLDYLQSTFPDMEIVSISGNFCADKKAAAVNWIQGRGKSVVCDTTIREDVVAKVLKTSVGALVELNVLKNLTGSAVAGALGGFNAHAANLVSAVFIATGQDPAQNVESSQCITMMELASNGRDLHVSVTMPAIEVGTIGGGTQLASQAACLDLLGVKGANNASPGANARLLAKIIAGTVLAGELSLMSALAAGHLVKSHMKYNRSSKNICDYQPTPGSM